MFFWKGLVASQFKTKVRTKGLTHMFCLWISSHKLCKEHMFPWLITMKCICQFGMNEEMFNHKWKLKNKWNIFLGMHSIYIFPFLLTCLPTQVSRFKIIKYKYFIQIIYIYIYSCKKLGHYVYSSQRSYDYGLCNEFVYT